MTELKLEKTKYRELVQAINNSPHGDRSNVTTLTCTLKNNIRQVVEIPDDKLDAALWDANPEIYFTPKANFVRVDTACIVKVFEMIKHYKS